MVAHKNSEQVATGVGLAAGIVSAVAAGFFLYGPKGKENRVKIKSWTLKAKAEMLEQLEKAKEVTEESYAAMADKVTAKYGKLKAVGDEEAGKLNVELKRHWKAIKTATRPQKKEVKKK